MATPRWRTAVREPDARGRGGGAAWRHGGGQPMFQAAGGYGQTAAGRVPSGTRWRESAVEAGGNPGGTGSGADLNRLASTAGCRAAATPGASTGSAADADNDASRRHADGSAGSHRPVAGHRPRRAAADRPVQPDHRPLDATRMRRRGRRRSPATRRSTPATLDALRHGRHVADVRRLADGGGGMNYAQMQNYLGLQPQELPTDRDSEGLSHGERSVGIRRTIGSGVASGIWGPASTATTTRSRRTASSTSRPERGTYDPGPNVVDRRVNALRLGYGTVDAPDILGMARTRRCALRRRPADRRGRLAGALGPVERDRCDWSRWRHAQLAAQADWTARVARLRCRARSLRRCGRPVAHVDVPGWPRHQNGELESGPVARPDERDAGLRNFNASSPYAQPNAGDYLRRCSRRREAPALRDYYGQRRRPDERARRHEHPAVEPQYRPRDGAVARQPAPEISQAMEAAGLGRSGAGQLQMLQASNAAREQAIRDKNRTMADYTDREANRRASAINLGSQIGAQGYGQYSQQMGQAALAGPRRRVPDEPGEPVKNEQALFSQQMQNCYAKNQNDQSALFDMLGARERTTRTRCRWRTRAVLEALRDWLMRFAAEPRPVAGVVARPGAEVSQRAAPDPAGPPEPDDRSRHAAVETQPASRPARPHRAATTAAAPRSGIPTWAARWRTPA